MKKLSSILMFVSASFIYSCSNSDKNQSSNSDSNNSSNSTENKKGDELDDMKKLYDETAKAKVEIFKHNEEGIGNVFRFTGVTYEPHYLLLNKSDFDYYIAQFTTTTIFMEGAEGQQRIFNVKIKDKTNASKVLVEINQECDEIKLESTTYKTISYGCCGAPTVYEIYDYNNRKIVEGYEYIYEGSIPNSDITMFVGYTRDDDENSIGTIHFSTSSSEKYTIKLKTTESNVDCGDSFDNLRFISSNSNDEEDKENHILTLWSMDEVKDVNTLNNITIELRSNCNLSNPSNIIRIPIINGKPFGNADKNQELFIGR